MTKIRAPSGGGTSPSGARAEAAEKPVERIGRRASSLDVARAAGVSQSAVSRTFAPGAAVSEHTRAKVKAAAEKLGYKPNALASSIITKRSRIIALVVGDIENPTYSKIVNLFSLHFQARGYHVLLFSLKSDDNADYAIDELLKYRVDGVLLTAATLSEAMAQACARLGAPVLLYNRYARHSGVSAVRVDNQSAGASVADLFARLGFRRIGFVAGSGIDETSRDREQGFVDRLKTLGLSLAVRAQGDYSFASGQAAMHALWAGEVRPDAIFLASDMMAFGAISTARIELGLSVPGDVSIVGFDDLPQAVWPVFDLTTVRQPQVAMTDAAAELLLAKIASQEQRARTILMPGDLIVRGSTPPIPA